MQHGSSVLVRVGEILTRRAGDIVAVNLAVPAGNEELGRRDGCEGERRYCVAWRRGEFVVRRCGLASSQLHVARADKHSFPRAFRRTWSHHNMFWRTALGDATSKPGACLLSLEAAGSHVVAARAGLGRILPGPTAPVASHSAATPRHTPPSRRRAKCQNYDSAFALLNPTPDLPRTCDVTDRPLANHTRLQPVETPLLTVQDPQKPGS